MTFRPSRKPWGPDGPKASPGGGSGQPAPKFQEESVLEVHVITSAPGVHSIKAALCAASPHVSVSFFNCKSNPIPRKHLQAAKDAAEQADLTIFFFTGVERALLELGWTSAMGIPVLGVIAANAAKYIPDAVYFVVDDWVPTVETAAELVGDLAACLYEYRAERDCTGCRLAKFCPLALGTGLGFPIPGADPCPN